MKTADVALLMGTTDELCQKCKEREAQVLIRPAFANAELLLCKSCVCKAVEQALAK